MIGERLLDLRTEAGLTQDELGKLIHVNKHSISSYERDKSEPPDEVKIRISQYFRVSIDYLLGMTDAPNADVERCKCVRLPANFPDQAMDDLKDYVAYLMQKYKKP